MRDRHIKTGIDKDLGGKVSEPNRDRLKDTGRRGKLEWRQKDRGDRKTGGQKNQVGKTNYNR